MSYVVYYCEHLRDGEEEGAKIKPTLESALEFIEHICNEAFAGCNYSFKLFELGKEIPLREKKVKTVKKDITTKSKFSLD